MLETRLRELATVIGAKVVEAGEYAISVGSQVNANAKRTMSAAGRARIIAAQKARWAKFNAENGAAPKKAKKTKRTMSPEAKAKIAAAQKKRWAKFHAAKKK